MRNSPFRQEGLRTGGRIATASLRTGLAMTGRVTRGAVGHMGPALQPHIFVGQGPCALPWVREKNPPVTALPCQPPLGKGAYKDGGYGLPRPVCALASQ